MVYNVVTTVYGKQTYFFFTLLLKKMMNAFVTILNYFFFESGFFLINTLSVNCSNLEMKPPSPSGRPPL
jgi:hypothetical protein